MSEKMNTTKMSEKEKLLAGYFVCLKCLRLFDPSTASECPECGRLKCPECGACLCSLSREAQVAALAVYITHARIPPEEMLWWYNRAKEIRREMIKEREEMKKVLIDLLAERVVVDLALEHPQLLDRLKEMMKIMREGAMNRTSAKGVLRSALQALLYVQLGILKDLKEVKCEKKRERLYELLKRINRVKNRVLKLYFHAFFNNSKLMVRR